MAINLNLEPLNPSTLNPNMFSSAALQNQVILALLANVAKIRLASNEPGIRYLIYTHLIPADWYSAPSPPMLTIRHKRRDILGYVFKMRVAGLTSVRRGYVLPIL